MVVSGVVTYWPSLELLQRLVDVLVTSTDRVLIFANYPMAMGERRQLTALGDGDCIEIFQSDENVGLGRAYNYLLERARSLGADAVFICDQDSVPHAETVSQLTQKFGALSAAGHRWPSWGRDRSAHADRAPNLKMCAFFDGPGKTVRPG